MEEGQRAVYSMNSLQGKLQVPLLAGREASSASSICCVEVSTHGLRFRLVASVAEYRRLTVANSNSVPPPNATEPDASALQLICAIVEHISRRSKAHRQYQEHTFGPTAKNRRLADLRIACREFFVKRVVRGCFPPIGVGKPGCAGLPSLRTVHAVLPHADRGSSMRHDSPNQKDFLIRVSSTASLGRRGFRREWHCHRGCSLSIYVSFV